MHFLKLGVKIKSANKKVRALVRVPKIILEMFFARPFTGYRDIRAARAIVKKHMLKLCF